MVVYVKSAINYSQWLSFSILITAILSVQITDHTSFGPKQAVLAATTSTASTSTTPPTPILSCSRTRISSQPQHHHEQQGTAAPHALNSALDKY